MSFDLTNASISNEEGNLLFYTNGIIVADATHQMMENGDSLNPGQTAYAFYNYGYIVQQGVIILPMPDQERFYYLFHLLRREGDAQIPLPYCPFLYYSLIDMEGNGGLGMVIEKNQTVISDTLDVGKLTAVKHANGRDWWILVPERDRYSYHRLLLTPDSILEKGILPVEPVDGYGEPPVGFVAFSPDGTKYARHDIRGFPAGHFVRLYDFDRCTGLLSNQIHIPLSDTAGVGGIAFSPDSRFMYVSSQELVYQFDVTAADVEATKTIVAETDGFTDTFNGAPWFPMTFSGAQLGPDGRIYIHSAGSSRYLHVIQYPNKAGLACEVRQHAIKLPAWTFRTIPNFPNYRLGPLDGSPCDTLGLDNHPLAGFRWEADTLNPLLVEFTDNSFYEPTDWSWDFGDGGSSSLKDPLHKYVDSGTYTVCLTVSNQYGSDTACREVQVEGVLTGTGETAGPALGVEVYPNPAEKELTMRFDHATVKGMEIRLLNLYGQVLLSYHIPEQTVFYSLRLPEMANGIYWLIIYSDDGQKKVKQVVINR